MPPAGSRRRRSCEDELLDASRVRGERLRQLDGARGFHALSSVQRWAVVAALALAFVFTAQKLLIIVGLVAVFRAFQRTAVPGDARALATFVGLVGALSWLSMPVR